MTPKEWNSLMSSEAPARDFKAAVYRNAVEFIAALPMGKEFKTEQIIEGIYPREISKLTLAGDTARKRIYLMLYKLSMNGLEDCCRKGEVNGEYMGKPKRPTIWFNPGGFVTCWECGHITIKKGEENEPGQIDTPA